MKKEPLLKSIEEQPSKRYIGWNFLIGFLSVGIIHGIYYLGCLFARASTGKWPENNPVAWLVRKYESAKKHTEDKMLSNSVLYEVKSPDVAAKLEKEKLNYSKPFVKIKEDFRQIDHDIYLGVEKYKANDGKGNLRIDIIPDMYFEKDSFMRYIISKWGQIFQPADFYAALMLRGDQIKERLLKKYPGLKPEDINVVHSKKEDSRYKTVQDVDNDIDPDVECVWFAHFYVEINLEEIPSKLLEITSPFDRSLEWFNFEWDSDWQLRYNVNDNYMFDLLKEAIQEYEKKGSKGEMTIKIVPDRDVNRIDFYSFFYLCREINRERKVWEGEDFANKMFSDCFFGSIQKYMCDLGISSDEISYEKSRDDTRFSKKDFPSGGGRDNPRGGNDFCPKVYSIKLTENAAHQLIDKMEAKHELGSPSL